MTQILARYRLLLPAIFSLLISACANQPETVKNSLIEPQPQATAPSEVLIEQPKKLDLKPQQHVVVVETENFTPMPDTDLWQRIRDGYAIPYPSLHPATQQQLNWYVNHPDYINRMVERARPYLHYIVDQLEQRDMPLEIALLPVVESSFQPFAYSHGRAAGLWQFIPSTGRVYGLQQNWWYDGRRDVIESTRAALDYLQKLHNDFDDWELALAAYNSGEGTVGRAIKRNQKAGKSTDFWSLDLPKETSAYVPKLLAISYLVKDPDQFNITLAPIDNSPFLTVVDIGSQIDLALAAQMAEMSTEDLHQLNPGFNRWATTPEGPHRLVIPLDQAVVFQQKLEKLPPEDRVQWTRHKIKSGESLSVIARHYQTTTTVIKQANGLTGNNIRAGKYLLIPIASGKASDYPLSASQRLATRQNAPRQGNKTVYTVKAGDTWWDIAQAHHVSVRSLSSWNSKAPGDTLQPGQKLVIWTKGKPSNTDKTVRTVKYTIRSGDSLWDISQKFNVSVAQVCKWNDLSKQTVLQPGQKLTLYIDVTQQYGSI